MKRLDCVVDHNEKDLWTLREKQGRGIGQDTPPLIWVKVSAALWSRDTGGADRVAGILTNKGD